MTIKSQPWSVRHELATYLLCSLSTKTTFRHVTNLRPADLIPWHQNVTTPEARSEGGSWIDRPSEQNRVQNRTDPVTTNIREMGRGRVCVWEFY